MMNWNYRVFQEPNGDYIIREVFYAEDGTIISCTQNAVEPIGQSLEALARDIEAFQEALTLPLLTLADIPISTTKKRHYERHNNISHEQLMAELGLCEPLKN